MYYGVDNISNKSEPKPSSMSMPMETDKQREEKRQAELLDIQKELEAKFDELFGTADNDNNE